MKSTYKIKKIGVSILTIACLFTMILSGPLAMVAYAADSVVVTADDTKTYIAGGGYQYVSPNLTLTGSGTVTSAKVYFGTNFVSGSDILSSTAYSSISGTYSTSTGVLTVTGSDTIANYQTFLRNVTYYTSATSGTKTIYFSVTQGSTSTYYYSGTGHFYEYVASAGNYWTSAKSLAEARTITANGVTYSGYLATITSQGENDFVADKCAGNGWIGASDAASEGVWKWVTGPEAGTQFWQNNSPNGHSVNSMYQNWDSNEPNDAGGEDYAHMYSANGTWNDFSNTNTATSGYLVEYGTTPISLSSSSIDSCSLTIQNTPSSVLLSATPASSTTMNLSWSATNATSYTLYRDGSNIYSGGGTSYTDTSLGVNTSHTYYLAATNAAGTTNSSSVTKYTYAVAPGLSVTNQTTYSVNDWTISAGSNPPGTTYIVQYSTSSGSSWNTLYNGTSTSGTHSGLTADTTYSYRACAYNGSNVATSYSDTQTVKTNDCPEITNLSPAVNIFKSAVTGYTTVALSGTVTDHDNDSVTLTATLNGAQKSTTVASTTSGAAWGLSWDVITDSFNEGSYTSVVIAANDGTFKSNAASSVTWTNTLYVDKTSPAVPTITNSTAWTNAASVPVTITNGSDASGTVNVGSSYSEYRYMTVDADTGDTLTDWSSWATYSSSFNITAAGVTTIQARTYDLVGNLGAVCESTVRIDRTTPSGGSFTLDAAYGDTAYTRNRTVNITEISADEAGAGVTAPAYMQISNGSTFANGTYTQVPYATSYSGWTMTDTDGEKTVYIRFVDAVGNTGAGCSDSIIYDSTPPVISISAPSRYAVKNGLSVSYTLGVDDSTVTLTGINASDKSFITLTASGTISANLDEMMNWMTVTNTTTTTRTVTITIPEDFTNEGIIAISVSSAAATDQASNTSLQVPGNFSFNVDCTAPTNQDLLFPVGLTVSGGEAVTLDIASINCNGGQAGDSVRFACIEDYGTSYDGTEPADGVTITSTHGSSLTIIAPTTEGTYKLYIIDEAGNISLASAATLTVKNDGPSVTIEGPNDSYVQAAATVEYIVTYSSDTNSITLNQEDVVLVRSGSANAYVAVAEIDGEPLQRKITLSNLMGEGTVAIRIAAGSAEDDIGNPAIASAVSSTVTVDNTPASLSAVCITSSNVNSAYAKEGDTVSISFTSDEPLLSAKATFCGRSAAVFGSGTSWTACYTIPSGTTLSENSVTFSVVTTDLAGNVSSAVTSTTDASSVTMDFSNPEITLTGDMDGTGAYYVGSVNVEFNEGTAQLKNLNSGSTVSISSGDAITVSGKYLLTVTDIAGNASTATLVLSGDYYDVMSDKDALYITYASGDTEDHVTRDVSLPVSGESGSLVTWSSSNGAVITDNGAVTRPTAGSDDAEVTLTATISKNGIVSTKTFALTLIAQPEDSDLAYAAEDAGTTVILYTDGDSQTNVTAGLSLAAEGILHSSILTWESDSEYVIISDTPESGYYTATVTRPKFSDGDASVTLTVTSVYNTETFVSTITVTVKKQAGDEALSAQTDADSAYITYQTGDDIDSVTDDITLVFVGTEGSTGVWASSNGSVININGTTGVVTRPSSSKSDASVTITLTVTNGASQIDKTFRLTVKALDSTPEQDDLDVQSDLDALEIGYRGSDSKDSVTTHIILATSGANGSTITWTSSRSDVVESNGTVTRSSDGNIEVTLTAIVTKGDSSAAKTFTITVNQRALTMLQQLGADADAVTWPNISHESMSAVTSDLTLSTVGANGCTITWSSSVPNTISTSGTVHSGASDVEVVLTAVIAKGGFYIVKSLSVTISGS
ncbi:MAG: immunoglobulin-like domain-containing protein [Clostridiaceae bacterium]|nr:immunoglobulin-like domain-containing protein [Clostridiaceae bacterium]